MKHIVVAHDKSKWCAVPANNGGNGPTWHWGNEILVGYTSGEAQFMNDGHQVESDNPHLKSYLARSRDGGETWETWMPGEYFGNEGFQKNEAVTLKEGINFMSPGFIMRVEGNGYHGNSGHQWFYSLDKGESWEGPHAFGNLFDHPELVDKEFTGRTGYLVNSSSDLFVFLSVRKSEGQGLSVSTSDKVFLAKTADGGRSFHFVSWVVPPTDPYRAVMPAPVRISDSKIISAIRRKDVEGGCWIDCYCSQNNGETWEFLSRIGDTGGSNGNPPAMIRMIDGRVCCVFGNRDTRVMLAKFSEDEGKTWTHEQLLRDGLQSINGFADLGYPRLFQRTDGKLVGVYFWCSPERPETHIEATIFSAI
ncbi:sialidase family protein [Neobacillus cucumis]|uniref:sialidase family protein n=1 Tax=Neobacillus cucumis TaxID=1740721 RepID=UPI0028532D26|nr:sialidase family protein [Neobacillus cucumis]MDR4949607.1 sialidase family protein [Neobacillus cucumis]